MSVTGRTYLPPQGSELNLLLTLLESQVKDPEQRIDWARNRGREFAQSGPGRLNVFAFKDFVQTPRAASRVQAAPQGKRRWKSD